MKNYCMFNYDYLFSDHFAKVSNQAKLYYIKLCFYANRGFVANPMSILDSLGFDKSVYWELVKNDEILTLPDRSEIFITSYFIHNPGLKTKEWWFSPFAIYWKGKLHIKQNGVATFKAEGLQDDNPNYDPLANIDSPNDTTKKVEREWTEEDEKRWNAAIEGIEEIKEVKDQ